MTQLREFCIEINTFAKQRRSIITLSFEIL